MCGAVVGLLGPAANAIPGLDRLNDIINPELPKPPPVPERPDPPERSTDRIRRRASLDPTVNEAPKTGLDFFTTELSNLFGK